MHLQLPLTSVRERADTEVYKGVAAPKRKRVEDAPLVDEIPKVSYMFRLDLCNLILTLHAIFASLQWLEIQPEDDEKTKAKKRKLLKSYKSKIRFAVCRGFHACCCMTTCASSTICLANCMIAQKLDLKTKEKQNKWQDFISGKGSKKKTGFFTGAWTQCTP